MLSEARAFHTPGSQSDYDMHYDVKRISEANAQTHKD